MPSYQPSIVDNEVCILYTYISYKIFIAISSYLVWSLVFFIVRFGYVNTTIYYTYSQLFFYSKTHVLIKEQISQSSHNHHPPTLEIKVNPLESIKNSHIFIIIIFILCMYLYILMMTTHME